MDVFVLRHGDAEPRSPEVEEAERKLTPKGVQDVRRVMRLAKAAKVRPTVAMSSPYRRALDTARIAMEALDPEPRLIETPVLLPDVPPQQVWKEIRLHRKEEQVLVVGHEPQFTQLVAYLLAVQELRLDFKKGGLIRIQLETLGQTPHGTLKWVLTPGLARATRRS